MDFVLDRSPFDPESHFLFWKPGSVPYSEPEDLAWRLDPGNLLILNAHLQPGGKTEEVQPQIGLYFAGTPATRFPILIQLEHDGALGIPPGARDFVVSDDFTLPVDADALAIYPHAHYLGKLIEAYATLPDGRRTWLIRIPNWDLNWQAVYHYRTPVFLPKGSVLSMRIHYDNSAANPRNPNHPPKRMQAGNNATDEIQEYRIALKVDPHYWQARYNLAKALAKSGDVNGAIDNFRQLMAEFPDNSQLQSEYAALQARARR